MDRARGATQTSRVNTIPENDKGVYPYVIYNTYPKYVPRI